jgi:galactonate dehydratase
VKTLKIEKVETWLVERWLAVRVTADDGTQGVGEGTFWSFAGAAQEIVSALAEDLIGQDASNIDRIWNASYRKFSFRSAAITSAMSAIDMALWDIKGKRLGAPVWDLLGGRVRDQVRAMVLLGGGASPDDFARSAARAKREGFTAGKMTPFPSGWSKLPYGELVRQNTAIVAAVRETVGWDFDIGIEVHRNMAPSEAEVFAQQIEQFLPYFYEDPIAPDSVMSMGDVAGRIRLPLAVGERNTTIWEFREYASLKGVHFLRPDVGLAGGITHVKKIAAIAESYHQRIIPHNFLGPVTTMACVQLAACTPNWDLQEYAREAGTARAAVVKKTAQLKDGYLLIPDAPGLGIEFNVAAFKKYPYSAGSGDQSRRPDGSVALR